MPRQITIRNPSPQLSRRLVSLSKARGTSLNRTVLTILDQAVGVSERRDRLLRYATWTPEDLTEFNNTLALQRTIDDELWK